MDLLRRGGVEGRQQGELEGNLADWLALRLHEQLEQVEDLARAMQVGFNGTAEYALELFTVFKQRRAVLGLCFQQETLVARVARERGVFVAVGDEFECFLAA